MGITQYDMILHNMCQKVSILHMLIWFHAALVGQNRCFSFFRCGYGMCTCSDHNCKQCCSFRLMYCKLLFDVLCDLSVFDLSIFQDAYSTWMRLNGLRGWTGLHCVELLGPWGGCLICKWREYLVENIVHIKLSIFNYCLICPNTV